MLREGKQLHLVVCCLWLLRLVSYQLRNEIFEPVISSSSRQNQQSQDCGLAWFELQNFGHKLVHTYRALLNNGVVTESELCKIASSGIRIILRVRNLVLDFCQC